MNYNYYYYHYYYYHPHHHHHHHHHHYYYYYYYYYSPFDLISLPWACTAACREAAPVSPPLALSTVIAALRSFGCVALGRRVYTSSAIRTSDACLPVREMWLGCTAWCTAWWTMRRTVCYLLHAPGVQLGLLEVGVCAVACPRKG